MYDIKHKTLAPVFSTITTLPFNVGWDDAPREGMIQRFVVKPDIALEVFTFDDMKAVYLRELLLNPETQEVIHYSGHSLMFNRVETRRYIDTFFHKKYSSRLWVERVRHNLYSEAGIEYRSPVM